MQLNLSDTEMQSLIRAIDSFYSDLREEIYHTENYEMRQSLKQQAQDLEQIRERLEPGWMARTGAGADRVATPPTTP